MFIAKVVGNLWATKKIKALEGLKLLIVQPVKGLELEPAGKLQMAVADKIDAGIGDLVLVMDEGSSASQVLGIKEAPIRTFIIGIIDEIYLEGEKKKFT